MNGRVEVDVFRHAHLAVTEQPQIVFRPEHTVHRVFKYAGQQPMFQIYQEKLRACINLLVMHHGALSCRAAAWHLDIPFDSRQDARMNIIFLRPSWAPPI